MDQITPVIKISDSATAFWHSEQLFSRLKQGVTCISRYFLPDFMVSSSKRGNMAPIFPGTFSMR